MRKKIIIGNWKMNLNLSEAQDLAFKIKSGLTADLKAEAGICPPFVYLPAISSITKGSNLYLGSQNMSQKESGALTGEISPIMLKDFSVQMVIIGHSERRQHFHETDEDVNQKIKTALKHNFIPVFCVGEELKVREAGQAEKWVTSQITAGIKDLTKEQMEKLIIAYEPIWAIGTGKICSGEDANKIIKTIRNVIKEKFSNETAEKVRILYGGSVKSDNFHEHIKFSDIDGGLVGGASLQAEEFLRLVSLSSNAHGQLQSHPAQV